MGASKEDRLVLKRRKELLTGLPVVAVSTLSFKVCKMKMESCRGDSRNSRLMVSEALLVLGCCHR